MYAAIYRWRVKPGREGEFEEGWRLGTIAIREQLGGLGSRLHKTAEGDYIAYAEWPDEETWRKAVDDGMAYKDDHARALYRASIAGPPEILFSFPVVVDVLNGRDG